MNRDRIELETVIDTRFVSPCDTCTLDDARIDELACVSIDCAGGGAPVRFMHPRDRAAGFRRAVMQGVAAGERALLVAEVGRGPCDTVQPAFALLENQPTAPIWRRCWCRRERVGEICGRFP